MPGVPYFTPTIELKSRLSDAGVTVRSLLKTAQDDLSRLRFEVLGFSPRKLAARAHVDANRLLLWQAKVVWDDELGNRSTLGAYVFNRFRRRIVEHAKSVKKAMIQTGFRDHFYCN